MSSYWNSENVVQIGETQVSIPCDLGQSFEVGSVSRKVSFEIPRSVKFISGKDCYLEMNVKINNPRAIAGALTTGESRLQWDPAGCGMMVQNIRIYDESRGTLIEEVNEYNQVLALKYDYDTDNSLRQIRQLEEGGTAHNTFNAGTRGNSKSEMADTATNPWFKAYTNTNQVNEFSEVQNNTVKACVPLYCGVFQGHIFPNMLTGMYVELDLAPAPRMVHQLDSVVKTRRKTLNPLFYGAIATDDVVVANWDAGNASDFKAILLDFANNITSIRSCPFVVGEKINFSSAVDAAGQDANLQTSAAAGAYHPIVITEIKIDGANGNRVRLEFSENMINAAAGGGRGVDINRATPMAVHSVSVSEAAAYAPTYTVSDLDLVVHQVDMDERYESGMLQKAREGSAIEFDIKSMTNYKNSITSSETQTTFLIHAQNHKAKSIVIIPTDSSVYTNQQRVSSTGTYEVTRDSMDTVLNSARSGIAGINDYLSTYQFQLNGKLVPSRPVSTRKIASRSSIDAFPLFELDKGLDNAGITPHSYVKFMDNFVIARGFAVNSGCLDLRGQDLSVILDYGETLPATVASRKNKMYNTFVFHLRRVRIRGGSVEIVQ